MILWLYSVFLLDFSADIEGLDISLIENPEDYPTVIHGTYFRNWDSIRREGLKRMQRTHIHFAPGEVGETGVISGMRSSAEIIIYIDLIKAINDGYKFYLSKNNVILCEGNKEGCLPTKYFRAAYQRNPRTHYCVMFKLDIHCLCPDSRSVDERREYGTSLTSISFTQFQQLLIRACRAHLPNKSLGTRL
ncbi:unnamed protein product [Schistosoma margrebowiei]|uniref:Uncharacterized protein n=1 Tax=Schistosoma margrebowiei TaxID=48269 RepID=A0A183M3W9_9TREM|nr:unnamed protein product [Schistosoma margrebowiei]